MANFFDQFDGAPSPQAAAPPALRMNLRLGEPPTPTQPGGGNFFDQFDAPTGGGQFAAPMPGGENFRTAREGVSEPTPQPNMLQKAIEPITSYPATYAQMNQESRDQMSEGVEQARRGTLYDAAVGAGKVALGGVGYVASPINAALRTVVGKPIEENTGIPKEYTEFAASLALPVPKKLPGVKFAPEEAAAARAAPTAKELKAAAVAGFESPVVKELEVAPKVLSEFAFKTRAALNETGLSEELAPVAFRILSKLENTPLGAVVTGGNLKTLRETFGKAAGSIDKNERRAAAKIIDAIDEMIPNIAARDILSGDPAKAAKAWELARGNYAAAMRSEDIAKAVLKAERQAKSAGSGANIDNATRQQFKAILNNPKRLRGFSVEEVAQMEQIVAGTTSGNIARLIGKAAPTGIVSGGLSAGAGMTAGGPVGAILVPLAGLIGKRLGDRSTARQVALLDEMVRARAPLAKSVEDFAIKVQAIEQGRDPRTMSAMVLSARNLVNNLKDSGINISPGEIIRLFQAPATGRAEDDQ